MTLTPITVIIAPDGALHHASAKISMADAERWVASGYTVFRVFGRDAHIWGMKHVGTARAMTSFDVDAVADIPVNVAAEFAALPPPREFPREALTAVVLPPTDQAAEDPST